MIHAISYLSAYNLNDMRKIFAIIVICTLAVSCGEKKEEKKEGGFEMLGQLPLLSLQKKLIRSWLQWVKQSTALFAQLATWQTNV